jgi:hypothetical protein
METILIEFENPGHLLKGAKLFTDAGFLTVESYSAFPIHGMDDAMKLKPSKLPWIVLCGGIFGLSGGFLLQTWVSVVAYPIVISGKPYFSYPAFIPVSFELMVLFSAFATVFGMFALIKLPEHYHRLFKSSKFRTATSHGFFLSIDSNDPKYDEASIQKLIESVGAKLADRVED